MSGNIPRDDLGFDGGVWLPIILEAIGGVDGEDGVDGDVRVLCLRLRKTGFVNITIKHGKYYSEQTIELREIDFEDIRQYIDAPSGCVAATIEIEGGRPVKIIYEVAPIQIQLGVVLELLKAKEARVIQ